MCDFDI